ncbi:hypothetical protein SCHPADRAFT_827523 [Schizopora paradoxa]|uniref:Pre-rRNA-processing protein n=1 Tax=Schizopora paradoxa TaxID=27342 RepID=A0A0H2RPI5_9AGAM|nr:hypothetical protein SCHPADRAFT_827523 [Schizopora paradoxa]
MAKSSKKRKEKNADFVKPKLKLGKGKQPAANAVDTSFKARTISVPQQSITTMKDDSKPTTKRKLTYDDLISHLKHYSPNVRKDSLSGLRELFEDNTDMVQPNLLSLLHSSVKLISDEDATVRKALLSFFEWLLRRVPQELLVPHSQTLLLFTTSAQTNIFAEVRIDAVRMLDLLLDVIPEQVVAGSMMDEGTESTSAHGKKVLDGYLSLLSASSRMSQNGACTPQASTSATVMLSPASKAIVLNSLSKFLKHTTKSLFSSFGTTGSDVNDASTSLWYMRSSFSDESSFHAFCNILGARKESSTSAFRIHRENPEGDFVGYSLLAEQLVDGRVDKAPLSDLSRLIDEIEQLVAQTTAGKESRAHEFISTLCGVLRPILISTFLDCAPTVFAPTQQPSESEVQLLLSVFEIARCVFGALLRDETVRRQSDTRDLLRAFLAHLSVYYPFGEGKMVAMDLKIDHAMQTMSLIYSELFSLLFATRSSKPGSQDSTHGKKRKYDMADQKAFKRQKSDTGVSLSHASFQALEKQSIRVRKYVIGRLRGQVQSATRPMGQPFTTPTYEGLQPTIWWLLNEGRFDEEGGDDGVEIFNVIVEHATRIGSTTSLKKASTEFVMRLVLLSTERHYRGSYRMNRSYSSSSPLVLWLLHLPKVLWEVGDKEPLLTEASKLAPNYLILKFLIFILQRRPGWLSDPSIRVALAARLNPFFIVQHPVKGRIAGPFGKLRWGFVAEKSNESRSSLATQSNLKALALDLVLTLLGASSWRGPSNDRRTPATTAGPEDIDDVYSGLRKAVRDAVETAGAQERAYWSSLEGVMAQRRV